MAEGIPKSIARPNVMEQYIATEAANRAVQEAATGDDNIGPEDNTKLLKSLADKAMARRRELHESGELLTARQMCDRLALGEDALRQAVLEGRVFWVEGTHGERWYPSFFADRTASRLGIEKVTRALDPLPGEVKWAFFTTPKYSLDGKTPIEALRHGEVTRALRTAAEFVVRNLGL